MREGPRRTRTLGRDGRGSLMQMAFAVLPSELVGKLPEKPGNRHSDSCSRSNAGFEGAGRAVGTGRLDSESCVNGAGCSELRP